MFAFVLACDKSFGMSEMKLRIPCVTLLYLFKVINFYVPKEKQNLFVAF